MKNKESELELMDYLIFFWEKKWMILLPSILMAVLAFLISFIIPRVWEIDAIVQPSKFFTKTTEGRMQEEMFINAIQLSQQINQHSYNLLISSELDINPKVLRGLRAENIQNTKLVRVVLRHKRPEEAKKILNSLFSYLRKDLDTKAEIERHEIKTLIAHDEINKARILMDIKTAENRLALIRKRAREIEAELGDVGKRINRLEEDQLINLRKEGRSETESLAMLLYSTEILGSLRYFNTLKELLSEKKIEEEEISAEIHADRKQIEILDSNTVNLTERMGRIDLTRWIKQPTESINPVFPKKRQNAIIALFVSFFFFTILAFFIDYRKKYLRES